MNANITKLYSIVCNNSVLVIETNLKHLIDKFQEVEPDAMTYHHYFRKFKEQKEFTQTLNDKEYHFQQLIP